MGPHRTAAGPTALVAGLLALTAGCGWVREGVLDAALQPLREPHAADVPPKSTAPPTRSAVALDAADRQVLAETHWAHTLTPAGTAPEYRWRHAALEELLARPDTSRPPFKLALADANPVVAANAAIALARLGDTAGSRQLMTVVRAPQQKMPLRCAAIEALGRLPSATALPALGELAQQYGNPRSKASYFGELHAELIYALARHVDPAQDSRLAAGLTGSVEAQLAALWVWRTHPECPLPERLPGLAAEGDGRVRGAALELLAARRHPATQAACCAALNDQDLQVRLKAIDGLGRIGGEEARTELRKIRQQHSDLLRGAVVAALARSGERKVLDEGAKDRSWRVRCAVAESLAACADRDGQSLAIDLLGDSSLEVQRRVLAAVQDWPLPLAGPVLFSAAERGAYLTRKTAVAQLAAAWPPAQALVGVPPGHQKELLADLRRQFQQQNGLPPQPAPVVAATATLPVAALPQTTRVAALLQELSAEPPAERRAAIIQSLVDLRADLLPALEVIAMEQKTPLPECVYHEVLPATGPVFVAVDQLTSTDLAQRRKGAETLAEQATRQPLPRLAVARLAAVVLRESDALVWRSALMALSGSPEEAATGLAAAGLSHPAPEVRRRSCVNLELRPQRAHLPALVVSLDDPSAAVAAAAARAIGACGGVEDHAPLARLLASPHETVRVEAASALARWGDPAGVAALERLAYSGDPAVRHQVATTMGDVGDPSFTPVLIHLLDDRSSIRRAALDSLTAITGWPEPPLEGPAPADTPTTSPSERQTTRWKQWFARQPATTTAPSP